MIDDTIAAISTPVGEGGIGIVRMSGSHALAIANRIFPKQLIHRRLVYGYIINPHSGEKIDEVLMSYMAAPHTYTREDMVEINCHGGPIPVQRVFELILKEGARLAHPGEFTLRAFLNGRIDLAQAEAVVDIIRAKTEASQRLALSGLQGRLSKEVKELRQILMNVLAYLTARIDFPEDEVEEQEIIPSLLNTRNKLGILIANAHAGIIYRQGVRVALVGRPNVGKSSLLNALLQRERAIVSPLPGTTRDTLEETISLKGIPFVLIDTAGIGITTDPLQDVAVKRSRQAITQADLVLMVIDISQSLTQEDREIWRLVSENYGIIVANKADLPHQAQLEGMAWPKVNTSALTGRGLPDLEAAMVEQVMGRRIHTTDELLVTNPRHQQALIKAQTHLGSALSGVKSGLPDDFVTIDLTEALNALGEITGETVSEELLDTIFNQFCVGK